MGDLTCFNGQTCMVVGHQKGQDTEKRALHNFDMSKPEGYCKAKRLVKLAGEFGLLISTSVDTPGAFSGVDVEEHDQPETIKRNLFVIADLRMSLIATTIGEGGSGDALAIAMGNSVTIS